MRPPGPVPPERHAMTRIIHLTDIHFGKAVLNLLRLCNKRFLGNLNFLLRRRRYFRLDRVESLLETLHSLSPDAVLVGGDFTTTATDAEFRMAGRFMENIQAVAPFVRCIPGNHDTYTFESVRKQRYQKYLGALSPTGDIPALSTLPGGMSLLSLPTARPNVFSARGEIREGQLARVGELLQQTASEPLVVLAHYPLLVQTESYHSSPSHRLLNADKLRALLGRSGFRVVYLCGHVHRFCHVRDPEYPNMDHLTGAALFYQRHDASGGFTEIELGPDAITVQPWTFRGDWTRDRAFVLPPR